LDVSGLGGDGDTGRDLARNYSTAMEKEEIWRKLEEKRFQNLKTAAVNLSSDMMVMQNRCPKCTLLPPCKHYASPFDILSEGPHLIQSP